MIRRSLSLAALAAAIAVGGAAIGHQHQGQHHQGMNHGAGGHQPWHDALHKAVASPTRTAANTARDKYRHPFETLAFFGVKPSDTVVEIWPSGTPMSSSPSATSTTGAAAIGAKARPMMSRPSSRCSGC